LFKTARITDILEVYFFFGAECTVTHKHALLLGTITFMRLHGEG